MTDLKGFRSAEVFNVMLTTFIRSHFQKCYMDVPQLTMSKRNF